MVRQPMKNGIRVTAFIVAIVVLALLAYTLVHAENITDVKKEENVGKTVKVRGEVQNVIKIGSISGYTLEDDTGSIAVSSQDLPGEGDKVTVKGTLIKDTIFGYYIKEHN